ncbi:MAG: (Fe-S)-binding protein [Chloroflexota bacterium]|nr:MAG: (Fe-S)-binding protein [Chloroflexota bacterium]
MERSTQLFITCIIDTLYPQTGVAVTKVLRRCGAEVHFPQNQSCCGQPAFNAGMRPQARQMAEQTIRVLEESLGDIVIPSGSCTGMIRHGYEELFADEPEWQKRVKGVASRTYEFTQYLVDVLGIDSLGARYNHKVAYHASCHLLRDLGIDTQPQRLLAGVDGLEPIQLPNREECCGFGGLFSIEHPEISKEMLGRKINHFQQSGASVLTSCDAGCIAHISGGLHRMGINLSAVHIAEILVQG